MSYTDTPATPTEICEFYDSHPNITIAEMCDIYGYTVAQMKRILMGGSR